MGNQPSFFIEVREGLANCLAAPDQLVIERTKKFVEWWTSLDHSEENKPA